MNLSHYIWYHHILQNASAIRAFDCQAYRSLAVCSVAQAYICGQNVNFVRGLVDKSLYVQINAIRIMFVKYKHKYRNQHAVLHKLYTWSLEDPRFRETKSDFFCRPLQNVKFRGTAGTHCLGEFQYLNHGFLQAYVQAQWVSWILA